MKKTIVLLCILVFLIAGCNQVQFPTVPGKKAKPQTPAAEGLEVVFLDPSASDYYRGEWVPIVFNIRNTGDYTINPGEFKVRLIGAATGGQFEHSKSEMLDGLSNNEEFPKVEPYGTSTRKIEFGSIKYVPESFSRSFYDLNLKIELCYHYQTNISGNFKFDSDTNKIKSGLKLKNSKAAVIVSSFKEISASEEEDRVNFRFEIKKTGDGRLVTQCFPDNEEHPKDKIDVEITGINDVSCTQFDGSDGGEIVLYDNKAVISCSTSLSGNDFYTSGGGENPHEEQIEITLTYDYDQVIGKTVTILPEEEYLAA